MSSSAANGLPANPFSQWKRTTNLDPNHTTVSKLPNELATLILSYLPFEQVQTIMESTQTQRNPYKVYRGMMGDLNCSVHNEHAKSSYTGKELEKFQRLLSLEGQALINGQPPQIKSWAELLAGNQISLTRLKNLDLSDATNMTDLDVIALTKSSPNLTRLVLPAAFPSVEVMAVLKGNCPQAAIYPSAMTEQEWAFPAEFMAKLPPPPQAIEDFINSPRPIWEEKTSVEAHMMMPRVNKIVRNIDGNSVMMPWTWVNVSKLDQATGGVGCWYMWNKTLQPVVDKPSDVGFEWIVFTKDILPGSRNKTYTDQKQIVEHWGYEVPGLTDATTCMLWENRLSGINNIHIYGNEPRTFTRCKEKIGNWHLAPGGFTHRGVSVIIYRAQRLFGHDDIGVGGLRKFKI